VNGSVVCYILVGMVLFALAGVYLGQHMGIYENMQSYTQCEAGRSCTISFDITDPISDRVYLYIYFTNYYQNHRRYPNIHPNMTSLSTNKIM
jgi:hypothetical protein